MNLDKATPELFAAIAKAQAEVENAAKNAANPHFKSKYADLAEVLNTVRPVFAKHGVSIMQAPHYDGTLAHVTTTLAGHGGSVYAVTSCAPTKADAQGIGSATTYLRRYSLAAMTGIAQEDDDGNRAAGKAHAPSDADAAKANDWVDAIQGCDSIDELAKLGPQIAQAGLPGQLLTKVRAAFAARKNALGAN